MLKKIFSMFKNQTPFASTISTEINELITKTFSPGSLLSLHLAGNVKIIVNKQYREPSIVMNIAPSMVNMLSITNDSISLGKKSINMINDHIVINGVAYPQPDFAIYTDSLKNLQLDGVADYTLEYIQPEHSLELTINGVGDVHLNVELYSLHCDINSVGNCDGTIHTHRLEIDHRGVGNIHFRGSSERGHLGLSGIGNFNGRELLLDDGDLFINSVGNAEVTMKTIKNSNLDSVGNITVSTSTPKKMLEQNGLGDLRIKQIHYDPNSTLTR